MTWPGVDCRFIPHQGGLEPHPPANVSGHFGPTHCQGAPRAPHPISPWYRRVSASKGRAPGSTPWLSLVVTKAQHCQGIWGPIPWLGLGATGSPPAVRAYPKLGPVAADALAHNRGASVPTL